MLCRLERQQLSVPGVCPPGNVKKLGATYPTVSQARNAELRLRWSQIVLKNDLQEDFWKVRDFLQSQVGAAPLMSPEA